MNSQTAEFYVQHLKLQPHPEGGFYRETYRATETIPVTALPTRFSGAGSRERSLATTIYYLLEQHDFSAFHRIKSDEGWHFYAGGALLVHVLTPDGTYTCTRLGADLAAGEVFQYVVPAGAWFASEPAAGTMFSLVGCTVAPGFDFADFEMARQAELCQTFPQHTNLVNRLCRL